MAVSGKEEVQQSGMESMEKAGLKSDATEERGSRPTGSAEGGRKTGFAALDWMAMLGELLVDMPKTLVCRRVGK
ncbi:hypothetical protein ABZS76_33320 [Streptomyces sp. NPDC005562]|uniref:hypothetical protein n=1 Tax=Streptomyces sp. NPDC005562 TaxID=3154890 RepID=UPI0033AEBB2C